ncbi:MAG: sigma-70 region 4 domain-containing protein [Armatimonadetes bacterium]|nr:sigma-70 region 4 domain-containing protein [Armatimonadota bacterium]
MVSHRAGTCRGMDGDAAGGAQERLAPGSGEAEAAAEALLVRARACGLRLSCCLRAAAAAAGEAGPGLAAVAEEIALSCAYYTEKEMRRRRRVGPRDQALLSLDERIHQQERPAASPAWLSGILAGDLEALGQRLGLSEGQTRVWSLHVQGSPYDEIARVLGISRASVRTHLDRAHRKLSGSWLAAYRASVR